MLTKITHAERSGTDYHKRGNTMRRIDEITADLKNDFILRRLIEYFINRFYDDKAIDYLKIYYNTNKQTARKILHLIKSNLI